MEPLVLKPIAHIVTDFPSKFGLPRQSMIAPDTVGTIVFEGDYANPDALRGLDGYSHLWVIWGFSEGFASQKNEKFSPTVRPPRLGGNRRMGVFATRSPNRPNPLALSVVRIVSMENGAITVSGIDMMDGTPIYDIKPYLPHVDAIPDARGGFAEEHDGALLSVIVPQNLLDKIAEDKRPALLEILGDDPRPHYQNDEEREYGFPYAGHEVRFTVRGSVLTVTAIE